MTTNDLLLLSSTRIHGLAYFEHVRNDVADFLPSGSSLAFAPYALADHDGYTEAIRSALAPLRIDVTGMHTVSDHADLLGGSDVLFVGGGNSFRLLKTLQTLGLVDLIRELVTSSELRYMGSSAGTNMACPTMRTTNDMPIVQPATLDAIGLIPFQINPHYQDPDPTSTHVGETREQRIDEFLEENDVPVLGIREGSWLRRHNDTLMLGGKPGARLFQRGAEPCEFQAGADLSFLLESQPRFDVNERPAGQLVARARPGGPTLRPLR